MTHHSNNASPLFSIIVATYNAAATLPYCLESIKSQSWTSHEVLIIDGGSTDKTPEIIKQNETFLSFWISEKDSGIYDAWNKGILKARGEWIVFLGADDRIASPDTLRDLALKLHLIPPGTPVAYANINLIDGAGDFIETLGADWSKVSHEFNQLMSIPHPGALHHRTLFSEFGFFDTTFRIAGDYELLLRALKNRSPYYFQDLITVDMRTGGISSNPRGSVRALMEVRRAQRKNGIGRPGLLWVKAIMKAYLRLALMSLLGEALARKSFDRYRELRGRKPVWTRQ